MTTSSITGGANSLGRVVFFYLMSSFIALEATMHGFAYLHKNTAAVYVLQAYLTLLLINSFKGNPVAK